ncbi:MAG: glutamyl-tRNA amidotransferase [Candidatus Vogelbacteria bacterium CG10_big_fil_rev_8_21_14_0_10_49_38]|uniref:Glutamyl-tRNA amidotransferase n=1 Tax=Candidatus Vogelbacteria bacterium CG10_big_fil_rev_8_21_14_0_10_49_38 TaxID=1975043 RepID=A0A2H0RHD0_9BACT|nr:MAG: glutamyl-tRNA amidotransferase [Candidatus Vogelbacteria bacterium CG10_big_fil_rev_8_21_14_0_10_49_38]
MMHQQIKDQIKTAMLAKDTDRLSALRNISAALTSEVMAKGRKPAELATDKEALTVLKRLAKQRQESIEQFTLGNRPERAEAESRELEIIKGFLPTGLSREEVRVLAIAKKAELQITDKAKLGLLTGAVMKAAQGAADGALVKAVVAELFD